MNTNQQTCGPKSYSEGFFNSINHHQHTIEPSEINEANSHGSQCFPEKDVNPRFGLLQTSFESENNVNHNVPTTNITHANTRRTATEPDVDHQIVVHQTINVPFSRRVVHALLLMLTPILITRVLVFASVKYDLLPKLNMLNDLPHILYQAATLLVANAFVKSAFSISFTSDSTSNHHNLQSNNQNHHLHHYNNCYNNINNDDQHSQALMATNVNGNLDPTKTVLASLATAAAVVASEMALETLESGAPTRYFQTLFSKLFKNNSFITKPLSSTVPSESVDLNADSKKDNDNHNGDYEGDDEYKFEHDIFEKDAGDNGAAATEAAEDTQSFDFGTAFDGSPSDISAPPSSNNHPSSSSSHSSHSSLVSVVDRISAVLANELGYKPHWLITKVAGNLVVIVYSFAVALLISFASVFYLLGIYLIVVRKWQRLYTFFKSVVTNEMLVTDI